MMLSKSGPRSLLSFMRFSFAHYKYPFNINQQQHATYLKRVEKAEQDLALHQQKNLIPRRLRRVYDKPRFDLDLTHYDVWRIYEENEMLDKEWAHGAIVFTKIQLQPKWVVHAFGAGLLPMNHYKSASREFQFEDNNLSKFLLYEYRNTTLWKENDPKFDYANQEHLKPRDRKIFRLTPEEFWKSQEFFEFRVNGTQYCDYRKFKLWIQKKVEESKGKESYDEYIDKKFGTVFDFNKKEHQSKFVPFTPAVSHVTPQHFALPSKKSEKIKPPKIELARKFEEVHRILPKSDEKTAIPNQQSAKSSKN